MEYLMKTENKERKIPNKNNNNFSPNELIFADVTQKQRPSAIGYVLLISILNSIRIQFPADCTPCIHIASNLNVRVSLSLCLSFPLFQPIQEWICSILKNIPYV